MIRKIIVLIVLVLLLFLIDTAYSLDFTCINGEGSYDGYRCGVDVDGDGLVEDCAEMLLCVRPDGGTCTYIEGSGYRCSTNGITYASAQICQSICGGTLDFMCPPDVGDQFCAGSTQLTNRKYMDLYPGDFENTTSYTFAITKSAVTRQSFLNLNNQYGSNHPANPLYRSFIWSNYGTGPFWVDKGTLYNDAYFGSPDGYACYYYESYNGSLWRPRGYCPGNNCTNYNVSLSGGTQRWERYQNFCSVTSFCQNIYYTPCVPTRLDLYYYLDAVTLIFSKSYNITANSGTFNYSNGYEFQYGGFWYGVELRCTASTSKYGYNVCTQYYQRVYGPTGYTYNYDYNVTFSQNGTCNTDLWYWVGPSLYMHAYFYGVAGTPNQYIGQVCHYPGTNSSTYNNTQYVTVSGVAYPLTTTCLTAETIGSCTYGNVNRCKSYRQCLSGYCWTVDFGDTCTNQFTDVNNIFGGNMRFYSNVSSSINLDRVAEYRDIPGSLQGIQQWDYVKCNPCMTSATGILIDDPASGPDVEIDETKTCTNFRMMSGSDKRCRPEGLFTIFADCCDISGWFKSWCNDEERELKKRKQAGTCTDIGTYCTKKIKFLGICLQRKRTYCCFNSKLSRIINEQGRPQISKGWGGPKDPDCTGFTPDQFSMLDFSSIDLGEYIAEIQGQVDMSISTEEITKGIQDWMSDQQNQTFGGFDE